MAGTSVRIPAWPSCMNCVSWSTDSEIAVASGEHVEILIPKLSFDLAKHNQGELESNKWDRLRLTINTFSEAELPYVDPRPFKIFSIGEEQSLSLVAALAWSPAGVARHSRCALAVLTTNHVLSIWAPDANPTNPRSWRRVLVLNKCLQDHFTRDSSDVTATDSESNVVQRCRVYAFEWAPVAPLDLSEGVLSDEKLLCPANVCHLVLSNGSGELVAVEIQSRVAKIRPSELSWSAHVLTAKPTSQTTRPQESTLRPSTNFLASHHTITRLSFTPWRRDVAEPAQLVTTLGYTSATGNHLRRCFWRPSPSPSIFVIEEAWLDLPCVGCKAIQWRNGAHQVSKGVLSICARD